VSRALNIAAAGAPMPADTPPPHAGHLEPALFSLEIEGCSAPWTVRSFRAEEHVSRPYTVELDAFTTDTEVDPEALLGESCQLSLARDGQRRSFAGLILGIERSAGGEGKIGLQLTVGPALALLGHRSDRRIWQLTSAVDIVAEIIRGPLAAYDREARWELDRSAYEPREYCVQHGESDLDLVHRLLAEEGIHYHFEIEDGRERVVFTGLSARAPVLQLHTADAQRRERGCMLFIAHGAGSTAEEAVSDFSWRRRLVSSASRVRAWSWEAAQEAPQRHSLDSDRNDGSDPGLRKADGARTVYEIIAPAPRSSAAEERERCVRHERRALAASRGRGRGDAIHLSAGHRFALLGHPDPTCDRGYFLTRVTHRGDAPEAQLHAHAESSAPRYRADFECIAEQTPYRPCPPRARTPQLETAIVVGPPGAGIHTDEHGRIQVRFHWDRREGEEAASCWLRVTQSWAGNGFGTLFLPRIGQEVVVDYLGADPDRPLVVGSLYNSLQRPPFTLPDDKEISGLRSDSTPGGGGHHELSFDDTKGRETLRIRAQRNMVERVLHDQTSTVGHNKSVKVEEIFSSDVGNEVLEVRESASRWVGDHYDVRVARGDMMTAVEQGTLTTVVEQGDMITRVGQGHSSTEVMVGDLRTTVLRGGSITHANRGVSVESAAGDISGRANGAVNLEAITAHIGLLAGESISMRAKSGDVGVFADTGNIVAKAKEQIEFDATFFAVEPSGGIRLESPRAITLACGASKLVLGPKGIVLSGPKISSLSTGPNSISGTTIHLN